MYWNNVHKGPPKSYGIYIVAGRMKYSYEDYTYFVDLAYYLGNLGGINWLTYNDWYDGQDEYEITHWMPLPDYPINNNEKEE